MLGESISVPFGGKWLLSPVYIRVWVSVGKFCVKSCNSMKREGVVLPRRGGLCLWHRGIWLLSVGIRKAVGSDAAWPDS